MGFLAVGLLRPVPAAAAAAVLAFGLTACGERAEPTGPSVDLYPVTVASGGDRSLVIHRPARRLVVLASGPHDIVVALGASRRIVGSPVTPNGRIRLQQLKRLRPDLIVAAPGGDEIELSKAAAAAGAPVYIAPGSSIREVERAITQLGLVTGRPAAARRLVHEIEARRRLVAARVARAPRRDVFVDTGLFSTVSDQSLVGDLIREARGRNVAGPRPDPGPFDLEQLAALDPYVYVATSESGTTLADLRRNRQTRRLTAVREGRVVTIDTTLLEPGPRVGEGLLRIASLLHPDAFR